MSMKDLLNKMSQLEALPAPKARQVLNESSPAPVATTTSKRSLKDVFRELSESIPAGAKPLPVMDPNNKQAGMGFLTSTNPAVADLLNTFDQKDVQIVQAPGQTQPGQSQPTAAGQPNPNQMQTSNQPNQPVQEDDDLVEYGDPTSYEAGRAADAEENAEAEVFHDFEKGGAEAFVAEKFPEFNQPCDQEEALSTSEVQGELNAYLGAQVAELLDRDYYDLDDEMVKDLLPDVIKIAERNGWTFDSPIKEGAKVDLDEANTGDEAEEKFKKYNAKELDYMLDRAAFKSKPGDARKQMRAGQAKDAAYNLMIRKKYPYVAQPSDENLEEGAKVDRMVKHIEKSEKKSGKSKGEAQDIAWATANKRGMLDNKNKKKVKEGDIAPTSGIDTRGAGLGAGRSMTTLEAKEPQVEVIDNAFNRENYKDLIGKKYPKSKAPAYARIKELSEGKKPDFLDLDKDGNRKEPMKKAAVDKKKKAVKENMNNRIQAARLEGKAHGLKGHAHNGKHYEDMEEGRAYHEGYKEGLDECYGMSPIVGLKREARMPATTRGMAQNSLDTPLDEMIDMDEMFSYKPDNSRPQDVLGRRRPGEIAKSPNDYKAMKKGEPGYYPDQYPLGKPKGVLPEDEMFDEAGSSRGPYRAVPAKGNYMGNRYDVVDAKGKVVMTGQEKTQAEASADFKNNNRPGIGQGFSDFTQEGNAFTGALARTPKGGKFSMGGRSYTDTSNLGEGDFAFEAWDRQLNSLINEGFSVSISKGEPNSPDSVNVNATDAEADMLLSLVKQAGMGIFGGDDGSDYGSPEVGGRSEINSPGGIEVVDDHDGMLGLMKKLSGIEGTNADYEEEDCGCEECGNSPCGCDDEKMSEARCNECGMMESKCGGHDEVLDEVESEDQMEFKVAEANAPDSGAHNSSNDMQGNAAANSALARADAGQDIEDGMQDQAVEEDLEPWMDGSDKPAFLRKQEYEKNMRDEIGPPALRRVKDEPEEKENDVKDKDVKESFVNLYKKLAMLSEEAEQLDELSPELLKRAATASSPDKRKYQAPNDVKFMSGKTYYYRRSGGGKPISIKNPDHAATYLSIDDEVSSDPAQTSLIKVSDIPELAMVIKARDQQYNFNKSKQDKFNQGAEQAMAKRLQAPPPYMSPARQRQYTKTTANPAPGNKEKVDEWANQVGKGPGKGTDASFQQSIDFMVNDISGGLNKRKSTGQATIPVVASQLNRLASRNTTSINENIESHIKSLRGGRNADDGRDHPEIDSHPLYDDLTSIVSKKEDEEDGARYNTLVGEADNIALRIAADTGFSAFSIVRYCSSHKAFNRWFYREKPSAFWSESISEMKRLAGLNEDDDGDGLPGVDAVSIAAKAAAAKGLPAPSAEEIAKKVAEMKQLFDFLDAHGQIAPEFSKTGNSKAGNAEAIDESLGSKIDQAKRNFSKGAKWFGAYLLAGALANLLGFDVPMLYHPWETLFGNPEPGAPGYYGRAFPLLGTQPVFDTYESRDLNEIRRLAGLTEDDDGDGLPGVDAVSIAAQEAAAKGLPAPSAEEIAANVDKFIRAYEILDANGQIAPEFSKTGNSNAEALDESLDKLVRDAKKAFWTAAEFLGKYELLYRHVLNHFGIPHPDLAHIGFELAAMLTPPSVPSFYGE